MYKYSLNLLPECMAHLYLRNDSIHEHSTRDCHISISKIKSCSDQIYIF